MQPRKPIQTEGTTGFFFLNLSHDNLENHFKTNFFMMHNYNYSLTELENMIPWEREVYLALLNNWLEEEKDRHEEQERNMRR